MKKSVKILLAAVAVIVLVSVAVIGYGFAEIHAVGRKDTTDTKTINWLRSTKLGRGLTQIRKSAALNNSIEVLFINA